MCRAMKDYGSLFQIYILVVCTIMLILAGLCAGCTSNPSPVTTPTPTTPASTTQVGTTPAVTTMVVTTPVFRWVERDHHQKLRFYPRNRDNQDRNDRHLDKPGWPGPPDRFRLRLSGLILIQFAVNRCIVPVYVYQSRHIPLSLCNSSLHDRYNCCAVLIQPFFLNFLILLTDYQIFPHQQAGRSEKVSWWPGVLCLLTWVSDKDQREQNLLHFFRVFFAGITFSGIPS